MAAGNCEHNAPGSGAICDQCWLKGLRPMPPMQPEYDIRGGERGRYAGRQAVWSPPPKPVEAVDGLLLPRNRETPQYVMFSAKSSGFDWIVTVYVKTGTPPANAPALRVVGLEVVPPEAPPDPGAPVTRVIELED